MIRRPPRSTPFPTRRSSDLAAGEGLAHRCLDGPLPCRRGAAAGPTTTSSRVDRKSTRLNSSHLVISYAVFCLKKKKQQTRPQVIYYELCTFPSNVDELPQPD